MITLNAHLQRIINGQNLEGLKPFAFLYRNKWVEESGGGGAFELETTPIDISSMIVKPNTLSMTLDVSEIAQYSANNVTLTLADPFNRFIEGTPHSFFPSGFQLYGSRVILYYGTSTADMTSLFVGVIKELPIHKPETYQVDLKLISPLELLNDIEAKEFSNKYTGETLTANGYDDDNNPIYKTTNTGVGGFNAVYADGVKIFEGVDYEVSQTNTLGLPALVTIINADYYASTITADYYCWKTGLSIEQIITGLVALGGYDTNTDIRSVVWNTAVTTQYTCTPLGALGIFKNNDIYEKYIQADGNNTWVCYGTILNNFKIKYDNNLNSDDFRFILSDTPLNNPNSNITNGIVVRREGYIIYDITVKVYVNGAVVATYTFPTTSKSIIIERNGANFTITAILSDDSSSTYNDTFNIDFNYIFMYSAGNHGKTTLTLKDNANNVIYETSPFGISFWGDADRADAFLITDIININSTLSKLKAEVEGTTNFNTYFRYGSSYNVWEEWQSIDIDADIGQSGNYFQFLIVVPKAELTFDIKNIFAQFLSSALTVQFVNLSGKTVLEAIQDLALISGYEFGVDRQGVFFFRLRSQSTTPVYDLDHSEIVKVDTVKKNLNDFFTKLTLTFAQIPLEFYANEGERPTPIDRYGVINKEIDKPEIVNYDNPELAQAIGPQLLAIYSSLANIIQCTSKLNLGLELGDIVNLKRNYTLIVGNNSNDYDKFINQNTYYRACKITGINYNLGKKQLTYTLRDVSNKNNQPQAEDADFKKPLDWSDIRLNSPDNSISIYVAHKADFSKFDNFAFKVRSNGGYKVYIDNVFYGNFNDNTQCNITWSTSGITTGDDITTPEALKAHKIVILPQTSGNELYLFKGGRVASSGYEEQGSLWYHFNVDYAVDIWRMTAEYGTYYSGLLYAVTAKNYTLKVGTNDLQGITAQTADLGNRSSQYITYLPKFYATQTTTMVNLQSRLNPPIEVIKLFGEGNYKLNTHSFHGLGHLKEVQTSNIIISNDNPYCTFQDCYALQRIPQIDFTLAQDMGEFITNSTALQDTILDVTSATGLKKIGCYGNSTYFMGGFKGLRVSNQAPFNANNTVHINVSYTGMSRNALRTLFSDLPTVSNGQIINVSGCTGNMLGEQGTVTFEDGIASGFSANDYYYFYKEFSETDKAWSIIIRAKVTDLSAVNTIISYGGNTKNSLQLGVNTSSKLVTYISSNGSSNDIANGTQSSLTINTNTYYYFKIEYTGANYIISVSEDDINYTAYITIDNATPIYNGAKLSLGFNQSRWPEALSGSIDFNETYFIVNGKTWFDINNMLTNADKAIATGKGWTVAA